jgi:hypothetical protein
MPIQVLYFTPNGFYVAFSASFPKSTCPFVEVMKTITMEHALDKQLCLF